LWPSLDVGIYETSAQNVEKKKAEPKTPHLLTLNQDIVACSEEQNWGLKYEIYINF
jgi:hypothetical protein